MTNTDPNQDARRISLANKCLILFGCAIVVILILALSVPWFRTYSLVREYQVEVADQITEAWLEARFTQDPESSSNIVENEIPGLAISFHMLGDPNTTPFISAAISAFQADPGLAYFESTSVKDDQELFSYAMPIRALRLQRLRNPSATTFRPGVIEPAVSDPLRAVLVVERTTDFGETQLQLSRSYIIITGIVAGLLAVIVFYFILTKLIFSPVRRLRDTAERVSTGDITARSTIRTGDEFEELSSNFNAMLDQVQETQSRLQRMNENLDLKVAELAEANVGLWESTNFKTEFLANVSHELRTPLNSIIGFAELLLTDSGQDEDPKRARHLSNILASGRSLLELINDLLDMAKIEAGRMEVNLEPISIEDLLEGLAGIMTPQASAKSIELDCQVEDELPQLETDPGKLQQILYNFLSNAIKFTPEHGHVTIQAESAGEHVLLSVSDTGPGIAPDMQDLIFEKFRQADASHTREFTGTGLGLAICRELAELLQCELAVESMPGRGSTFSVTIPLTYTPPKAPSLMG
ncbi:MAG: histidine kinase [Phycisphaerae bacterium]|nr:histidine kinase [Phycisphaerae bacterium]